MHSIHDKDIAKPPHVPSDIVGSSLNSYLLRLERTAISDFKYQQQQSN
jgi:hypothetical protein